MSSLFLVQARVIETDYRSGERIVKARHGEGVMLSFGQRGWLMGYRNRLWTMSDWGTPGNVYYHDWPRTVRQLVFRFDWFNEKQGVLATGRVFEKRSMEGAFDICRIHNGTHHLVRLQRWVRQTNARRRERRLALAMALHPRLGRTSWLSALDADLVRGLVLVAT